MERAHQRLRQERAQAGLCRGRRRRLEITTLIEETDVAGLYYEEFHIGQRFRHAIRRTSP